VQETTSTNHKSTSASFAKAAIKHSTALHYTNVSAEKKKAVQTGMNSPSESATKKGKRAKSNATSEPSSVPAGVQSQFGEAEPVAGISRATGRLPSARRSQQSSHETEEELEAAEMLASQSATGDSRAGPTPADKEDEEMEDASNAMDQLESEAWEDVPSSDEETSERLGPATVSQSDEASAQPDSATVPQPNAASVEQNLESDPVADGGKKKKQKREDKLIAIPLDRVWSKETLTGKGNMKSFRHWLDRAGRDSTLPQYQVSAAQLAAIVNKAMRKRKKERLREQERKIAKGKQREKALEKAARSRKRKARDDDSDTGPKDARKKKRVAPESSSESFSDSSEEQVEVGDETKLAPEPEEYVPEPDEEDEVDEDELELQRQLLLVPEEDDDDDINPQQKAKVDEVRKNLEAIRLAALDSLQLHRSYRGQTGTLSIGAGAGGGAQQDETETAQAPKHYAVYEKHNPQLILQDEDETPIFDYKTQMCVRKIVRARAGVFQRMHDKKKGRSSPYLVKLTELKGYCREISTTVGKVLKEDLPVDYRGAARMIINDLFLSGFGDAKSKI
jgi:hypothetical protein